MYSRDTSLAIAMGYGLHGWGSIPGRGKRFVSTAFRPTLGPTQYPIQWVQGPLTSGGKAAGREADNSPPSSAEVNNCGAIPPLPNMSSRRGA
jgi:hypothetical protein